MSEPHVPAALKAIRTRAKVGVREMARRLGMPGPSSYAHYEDPKRFKDAFLPLELTMRIADALDGTCVNRDEVLALAGSVHLPSPETIEARMSRLSADRQRRFREYLADLEAAEAADQGRQAPNPSSSG